MTAPTPKTLTVERPLGDGALRIVPRARNPTAYRIDLWSEDRARVR
jgi:hypothetical protein